MTTCAKIAYHDKKAALGAINLFAKRGRKRNHRKAPDQMRAYHCDDCNAWHVTSRPNHGNQ